MVLKTPPTPERASKNIMNRLRIDYLLERGTIDDHQHAACLMVRRWFDVAFADIGLQIMRYGDRQAGSVQSFAAYRNDCKSRYHGLIAALRPDDAIKFAAVVCYDETLKQAHIKGDDFRLLCDEVGRIILS